jgi:3-oxoacyl-[acyl-carrier-protein] synthase III
MSNCVIAGSSFFEPTEFYSSEAIEELLTPIYERLKLPKGRLGELTGIDTRGCYGIHLSPGEIASFSAKQLLDDLKLKPSQIDALIYCGVCKDALEPATSAQVHFKLKLSSDCLHFDVSNACLGMMNGIHLATKLLGSSNMNHVIVTTGENSLPMLNSLIQELNSNTEVSRKNIKLHIASLTLGSASLSLLISKTSLYPDKPKILDFHWKTDSQAYQLCQALGDYWQPRMKTSSEELLIAGVKLGKSLWDSWDKSAKEDLSFYLTHQVGKTHQEYLTSELKLERYNTYTSYQKFGNTGSAAVALTWHLALKNSKLMKGQKGVWLGIGSGLNAMLMHVEV